MSFKLSDLPGIVAAGAAYLKRRETPVDLTRVDAAIASCEPGGYVQMTTAEMNAFLARSRADCASKTTDKSLQHAGDD